MGLIVVYHTFVDGKIDAGKITADRINTNFSRLYNLVNGLIDADNLANPFVMTSNIQMTGGAVLKFIETGGGTDYVGLKAPASISASLTWLLPNADGSSGQVLKTDGAGNLGWVSVETGPATDHGTLTGLTDDDHTQYSLLSFKTIVIAGQSDVVADARDDTLTLVAGSNVTLTTAADAITIAASSSLPAGVIVMWHGLIANIPAGWTLCDGTSGTPDLREKFVKGAADLTEAGDTGGAATHSHDNHLANGFTHSGTAVAAHSQLTHAGTAVTAHGLTLAYFDQTNNDAQAATAVANHTVTQPSAHTISTHSVTQPDGHGANTHSTHKSEPAYYTILFIMKT